MPEEAIRLTGRVAHWADRTADCGKSRGVLYGEAAALDQAVLRPRQFYTPVVPDVSSRGRPHSI